MKIYDCFTFFNELELLELRLSILNPVVDKFIIVELNKTHRGKDKPFYLEHELKADRFKKYADKIIYLKEDNPPELDETKRVYRENIGQEDGDWSIENYQRNCIMHGLLECRPDDLIMISDLDEIPSPDVIRNLDSKKISICGQANTRLKDKIKTIARLFSIHPRLLYAEYRAKDMLNKTPIGLEQDMFYYYINCKSKGKWHGTVITKYENMSMPQILRNWRSCFPCIKKAGWHFSYLGGFERIREKLTSVVDGNALIPDQVIMDRLKNGKDLFGRTGSDFYQLEFISLDDINITGIENFVKNYPNMLSNRMKKTEDENIE